jgi:uncharacterized protein YxeA
MKKTVSIVIYLLFIVICSVEVVPKLIHSSQKEVAFVPYSAGIEDRSNSTEEIDYGRLLENANMDEDTKF